MKMTQEKHDELVACMMKFLEVALNDPECVAIKTFQEDGSVNIVPCPPQVGCEVDLAVVCPYTENPDGEIRPFEGWDDAPSLRELDADEG